MIPLAPPDAFFAWDAAAPWEHCGVSAESESEARWMAAARLGIPAGCVEVVRCEDVLAGRPSALAAIARAESVLAMVARGYRVGGVAA